MGPKTLHQYDATPRGIAMMARDRRAYALSRYRTATDQYEREIQNGRAQAFGDVLQLITGGRDDRGVDRAIQAMAKEETQEFQP